MKKSNFLICCGCNSSDNDNIIESKYEKKGLKKGKKAKKSIRPIKPTIEQRRQMYDQ
jgi:hypothetical protein